MDYINAIIFGIIQGITEFLPISSSGHLVILHKFINLPIKNELAFDVVLHLATLLAVVWFFRNDVYNLLRSWFKSFTGHRDEFSKLSWLIILATIPAGLAGWYFEETVEYIFRSLKVVVVMLIIGGVLLLIVEKISRKIDDLKNLSWAKALIIGLAQTIALIPGTSRSGITIIAGLATGLKRQAAVRFSFLMSVPIIFGASIRKAPQVFGADLANSELIVLIIAFIFSFISGFLAIKYFLRFAQNHSLNIFAVYRFALAAVIIVAGLFLR